MKWFPFIPLAFFLWGVGLSAQTDDYTARLDSQDVDGKTILVGWFENNTTSPLYVKYEAVLKLKNQTEEVHKGRTLALPGSPTLLTKAIFTIEGTAFEHLRLVVTNQNDEILAFDITHAPPSKQTARPPDGLPSLPLTTKTQALKPSRNDQNKYDDIEISGLVLDETRSKLARDFYETFYRNWSTVPLPPGAGSRTIIVREQPGRIGIGTSIVVEVDDRPVTRFNLQPRASVVEDLAGQLVVFLEKYLTDPNNRSIVESDDLTGSGIY